MVPILCRPGDFFVDIHAYVARHSSIRKALFLAADLLSGYRLLVAFTIVGLGVTYGKAALFWVVVLTMSAWMGDFFDGKAARLASGTSTPRTRFGRYDFVIDATLTFATLIYLSLASFVPLWLTLFYLIFAFLVCMRERWAKTVVVAFMRPVDLTAGFFALYSYRVLAVVFLLWLLLVLYWNWKRVKVGVPYFFKDMYARLTGRPTPSLPARETWGELHEEWPWEDEEQRERFREWREKLRDRRGE